MKKKIQELGDKYGLNLSIVNSRTAFDIIDYEVFDDIKFIGVYRYYTGKTSTGVEYPTENFLTRLESDLIKYLTKL